MRLLYNHRRVPRPWFQDRILGHAITTITRLRAAHSGRKLPIIACALFLYSLLYQVPLPGTTVLSYQVQSRLYLGTLIRCTGTWYLVLSDQGHIILVHVYAVGPR